MPHELPLSAMETERRVRQEIERTSAPIRRGAPLRPRAQTVSIFSTHSIVTVNCQLWREVGDAQQLQVLDKDYFGSIRGANNAATGNLPYKTFQKVETLNPANPKTIAPDRPVLSRINIDEPARQLIDH